MAWPPEETRVDLTLSIGSLTLARITGTLRTRRIWPAVGPMTVRFTQEDSMSRIVFDVTLPPPAAADVVRRKFTLSVAGEEPLEIALPPNQATVTDLKAPQGAEVGLRLVDVDDAGNESEPRVQSFVATDTIPPPQPGEMGITVTAEEPDPAPPAAA
jgi:hypothetical protein